MPTIFIIGGLVLSFLIFACIFIASLRERKITKNHVFGILCVVVCFLATYGIFPASIDLPWGGKIVLSRYLIEKVEQQNLLVGEHGRTITGRPSIGGTE